jgi:peptidoglycan/xylan/chitin deacetylase (PgdA/CDA1 family)
VKRPGLRGRRLGLVLCYHRIAEDRPDSWELCVSPDHFAEHLAVISAAGRPAPLAELAPDRAARAGRDRPLVALTFDDGYADNLHRAKPLLEAADVPATVFVVSGAIGQAGEFWWDELERAVLGPEPQEDRGAELRDAHGTLRLAAPAERQARLAQLHDGRDLPPRESRRALTEQELLLLADGGLVEIGGHTVTHPVLASLPEVEQRWEAARSRAELEDRLDRPVRAFAYPYGRRQDYSATTVQAVREAGYATACTTRSGVVYGRTHPYELPRCVVGDWDGDRFAEALDRWLGN